MEEIWKDIEGYEGIYQVSNLGRVKSFNKYKSGIILKPKNTTFGYLMVGLYKNPKAFGNVSIHRLVAKAFIPNVNNKRCVNHIDGNKKNNNINNLEWCTNSENQLHAYRTGLQKIYEERITGRKKVKCIEKDIIFKSLADASEYMGKSRLSKIIGQACKSTSKVAYGLHWEFIND